MKPLQTASSPNWQLWALAFASLIAVTGPVFAASSKPAKGPAKFSADARVDRDDHANSGTRPEFADVYPSWHRAAPDLLLTKDEDRKAEAFASFAQAVVSEDNSEADKALAGYRRALDLDPSNTELAVKVAFMLTQRDEIAEGIQVLKDNIKASPKDPLPLVFLSQIYVKNLKKSDLALKYAEQALNLDSSYLPAYVAVFELLQAQHQAAKAEQLLQRAAKSTTLEPAFWASLGELFIRAHFKDDGTPVSPEALKQTNAIFHKAAELGKDDAVVLAKAGNYFIDSKQVKEAIPLYARAIGLKPNSQEPVLVNAKEKLARALSDTGDRDDAIKILEEITKTDPLNYETFEFLGELYQQKGDMEKALANYRQVMLLNAGGPENHLRVAEAEIQLKRFDEAVETAKAARARFPEDPQTHVLLALTLSLAKHNTEAMTAFAEAQSEFEVNGHEEFLNAEFFFRYGAAAEQAGLMDKAAELLKKAIDQDPRNSAQAYNYLGYMWADRGEHLDEAADMIKKALEEDPDKGEYLDSLGWVYFKKGDFEVALTTLLKAAENIKPEDATVYDHLADTYQKMGNIPEALRYWQKAITLHPEDIDTKKISEKIDAAKQKVTSSAVPGGPKAQ